jgi:long-chain acyl-CoA synthetase
MGGIEVAIDAPDENGMGEIIVRGPNVMLGYYEDEEATREVLDKEGWFRTGDLGTIDASGIIRITGRAKSMIVLTNGKKAFPEEYEVLLNNLPGVKESYVWGNPAPDGDIQVCAQLVVDDEKLKAHYSRLPEPQELSVLYNDAIRELNKNIPQYKIIRYFILTREELVKTTTLKIKRPVQNKKVADALEKAALDMRKASGRFV